MNIKEIAGELINKEGMEKLSYVQLIEVLNALSELMFEEGKISDVLIANGKKRSRRKNK